MLEIYPFLRTVKSNDSSVALERHLFIFSKVWQPLDAVGIAKSKDGQTFSGNLFLARMDDAFQSGVQQYRHTTVGNHRLDFLLLFTEEGTVV